MDAATPMVLVADNDTAVNSLLCEVLARSGLRTAAVEDGASALKFLDNRPVSLLVCDLDMPVMSGEEVLEALGARSDAPPILVVSGYLDAELERRLADHAHVRGVFRKPFDVFSFAETVSGLVASSDEASQTAS